ncbi:hypothetical protein EYZ11_012789 [Aspergillus tanneri]|uniref:Uncharacterized protein n=1 Tax=Aspergillus tanneri TaxID=1220188 RepID=A0A4S3IZK9_9EURO|nr:hypothetical protein EYZ11_012789 [Aspergillus tanneri]
MQNGRLNLGDFLRHVTWFIIHNKDHIPHDSRLLLSNTFGKCYNPSSTESSRLRANEARKRISQIGEIDILPSPELLSSITEYKRSPSTFWTAESSVKLGPTDLGSAEFSRDTEGLFRYFYWQNRRNNMLEVLYRAFTTTATYLLVQRLCQNFEVTNLTPRVLRYCSGLVTDQHVTKERRQKVEDDIKADYRAGNVWNTYAGHLGGYGAFFLIGVVPSWMISAHELYQKPQDVPNRVFPLKGQLRN